MENKQLIESLTKLVEGEKKDRKARGAIAGGLLGTYVAKKTDKPANKTARNHISKNFMNHLKAKDFKKARGAFVAAAKKNKRAYAGAAIGAGTGAAIGKGIDAIKAKRNKNESLSERLNKWITKA